MSATYRGLSWEVRPSVGGEDAIIFATASSKLPLLRPARLLLFKSNPFTLLLQGVWSKPFIAYAGTDVLLAWLGGSVPFHPSCGAGKMPIAAALAMVGRSVAFGERLLFVRPLPLSIEVGVGSNPLAATSRIRAE